MPFTSYANSVSDITAGTKTRRIFQDMDKSFEKKKLGTKVGIAWKCRDENGFYPLKES